MSSSAQTTTQTKNTNKPILKRATGIYLLACLFILAPIGNILISFAGSGIERWYEPSVLRSFLQTVPVVDWIWLGLLVLTGLLLFKPHKLSWSVAIFSLIIVLIINATRLFQIDTSSIDHTFLKIFSSLAILVTLGVLVISFYFRFPYLDRRTKWFSDDHNPDRRGDERDEATERRDE